MQDTDVRSSPLQTILIPIFGGALLALGSCCVLLLLCSAMVYAGIIPEGYMEKLCAAFVALGSILGGRYAVKRGAGAPFLMGVLTALLLCLLLLAVAYMAYEQANWQGSGLWILLGSLLGGCFAGLFQSPRSAKMKKRKKH